METDFYVQELVKYIHIISLKSTLHLALHYQNNWPSIDSTVNISVFRNIMDSYSFCISINNKESFLILTDDFYNICDNKDYGTLKEIVFYFKLYLHSNGFEGEVKFTNIML